MTLTLERKPMLPPFGKLALAGLAVDAPFIAFAMIAGNLKLAVSLAAGYLLALAVNGMQHAILGPGLDLMSLAKPDNDRSGSSMSVLGFVAAMMGKYVLIGALLFIAWRTHYLLVLPFLGGFLLAQIGITCVAFAQSKKNLLGR
ncbi:MAG TPA: hypothetical protein VFW40_12060 [Capsulimonadaceae bacterium]|nr:hypothetical protein [Capsulimonadaceae bacterium]